LAGSNTDLFKKHTDYSMKLKLAQDEEAQARAMDLQASDLLFEADSMVRELDIDVQSLSGINDIMRHRSEQAHWAQKLSSAKAQKDQTAARLRAAERTRRDLEARLRAVEAELDKRIPF
jgi:hypothetical protein